MDLKMPIKIKEPESTLTGNESRPTEAGSVRRNDHMEHNFPPEHLLLSVVMTFSGDMPRLTAKDIDVVAEGGRIEEAFSQLIERTREWLASSDDARAALLRYPPSTWFRFVAPDEVRDQPSGADFWPEGEDVEDFIAAATEGRYEEDESEF